MEGPIDSAGSIPTGLGVFLQFAEFEDGVNVGVEQLSVSHHLVE
jgi:hypothetical protein